jgi:polyisoprenoid-binding protein YceI
MRRIIIPILTLILAVFLTLPVMAEVYEIDPTHSSIGFSVKHMVISKVRGGFDTFSGQFEFKERDPSSWRVTATAETASVNTGNDNRDEHLRNADFFDVEKFPTLTFEGKHVTVDKRGGYLLHGELTLHGVTKHMELVLEYNGSIKDPWGNNRAGFSASGKINRKDYGLAWNKVMEGGGLTVGEDVEITIEIEGIRQ